MEGRDELVDPHRPATLSTCSRRIRATFARSEFAEGPELAVRDPPPEGRVPLQAVDEGRRPEKVRLPEQDPAAVHGLLDGARGEADDGHPHVKGLEKRDAEALVVAEAQVTAGQPEIGHELGEVHVAGEVDVRERQPADEVLEGPR